MVVGGSRQETLDPGFVLLGTRQQVSMNILLWNYELIVIRSDNVKDDLSRSMLVIILSDKSVVHSAVRNLAIVYQRQGLQSHANLLLEWLQMAITDCRPR
ncbi:unnamed protein product, partial [Schistosoma curassoni]|uniref:DUF4470 domain-containing protein n=1 Tax=Schistosoma curassoni TaxID=6186 RepID=A0A183JR27_9TREM